MHKTAQRCPQSLSRTDIRHVFIRHTSGLLYPFLCTSSTLFLLLDGIFLEGNRLARLLDVNRVVLLIRRKTPLPPVLDPNLREPHEAMIDFQIVVLM